MALNQENLSKSSDDALVLMVQEGNKQAYNILVIRYQHKIFDIALKFVNNYQDASDIAQEAFVKAYKSLANFRADSSFYTWLYRITVNCAKSFLESSQKHKYSLDVDAPEFEAQDSQGVLTSHDSPDKLIESEELRKVIFRAFNELPEDQKQAITLREIEGMSYEDIAQVMKIPIGTVRSRIFRARQYIEEQMSKL